MSQQNQNIQEGSAQSSDQNINFIDIPKRKSPTIVYQSPPKVGKKQIYSKNNEDHIEIEMEDLDPEPKISTYKRDYKPFKVVVLDPDTMQPLPLPQGYHTDISSRDENVNIVYFVPSPTTKEARPKYRSNYQQSQSPNHRPAFSPRRQPYKPILRQENNNNGYNNNNSYYQQSPYYNPPPPPPQPYYPNDYRYSENHNRYPPPPPPELRDNYRNNSPYKTPLSNHQPNVTLNTTQYPSSARSQYHGYNNYCDRNYNNSNNYNNNTRSNNNNDRGYSMHINRIDSNQRSFSTPSNVRHPLSYETNYPIDRNYRPSYESSQKYGVTYFHPKAKPHPERWEDSLRTNNYGYEDMADVEKRRRMKKQREKEEQERRLYYPRTPFTEEDLEMRRRQRLIAQNEFRNHLLADRSNSKGKTVEPEFYFPENRNYHHHHHNHNHQNSSRSQSVPPSRSGSYYLNNTPYNNTHQYSRDNYDNDNSYSSSSSSDSESESSYRTPQSINSYSDDSISITDEPQIQRSPLPHQRNPSFIPIKTKNNNNNNSYRSQTNHQHKKKNNHHNKHHHKKTAINKNRIKSPFKPSFNLSKTTYINRIEDDDEEPQPLPQPKSEPQPEPQIDSDEEPEVERRNVDVSDNEVYDNNDDDDDSDVKENTYDIPIINVNRKKSDRPTIEELKNKRKEVEKLKKENELMRKYEEERTNDLLLNAYNPRINANTFNSNPPSSTNPLAFVPNSSNYVQGISNYDPNEIQNIALSSYNNNNNNNNNSKRSNSKSIKVTPRKPLHADALDEKHDHHGNHSIHNHYHHHESRKESPNKNKSKESAHSHHHHHHINSKDNVNYNNRDSKGNTLNDISSIEPVNESNVASNFAEVISHINRNIDPQSGKKKSKHNRSGIDDEDGRNKDETDGSDNEEDEEDVDYKKVIKHSPQMHFCSEHICCNPPITYYLNNDNIENVSVSNYSENEDENDNINRSNHSATKRSDKQSENSSKHSDRHSDRQSETNHLLSQISHSHASSIDGGDESDDDISIDSIHLEKSKSKNKNVKKQEKQQPIEVDEELKKKQITFVKNGSDTKLKSPQQRTHSTSSDPTPSPERNPLINDDDGDSIHDKMQFDDMDSVLKELKDLRKEKHLLKHHNEQLNALSHQLHLENKTMREILSKTQTSTESN